VSRPKKVVVGAFTYSIEWAKDESVKCQGSTCLHNRKIIIYPHRDLDILRETLAHEIEHCVLENIIDTVDAMDVEASKKEEAIVTLSSPIRYQVYRDNPQVTKFIFG
jgi:hypothetical protein